MMLQIAESPSLPRYSVLVGPAALWDCDCSANTVAQVLKLAQARYPGAEVVMFDDPRHYSNERRS